jgi:hypothetical protein
MADPAKWSGIAVPVSSSIPWIISVCDVQVGIFGRRIFYRFCHGDIGRWARRETDKASKNESSYAWYDESDHENLLLEYRRQQTVKQSATFMPTIGVAEGGSLSMTKTALSRKIPAQGGVKGKFFQCPNRH